MERQYSAVSEFCSNCQAASADGVYSVQIWPDELDKPVSVCEDCAAEVKRVEGEAAALCLLPSCEERQRIMDGTLTVAGMVNALRAHDMIQCAACLSDRKTVQSDRMYVDAAAVCCKEVA